MYGLGTPLPSPSFSDLEFLTPVVAGQPDYSWVDDQAEEGGLPPFSTKGSKSSTPLPPVRDSKAVRAGAYALRTSSRSMVGDIHNSLACCGFVRKVFRPHGSTMQAEPDMAVLEVREDGRATYANTTRCNSPWACPVCAPRLASARGQALQPQVAALMEKGWSAWLITLTVRHKRCDNFKDLLDALGTAWKRSTTGRAWQAVRNAGKVEYVRGYDVTHSNAAGWHPHVHLSLYLSPDHENPEEVARDFLNRWRLILGRLGWDALPGAQHVTRADNPEAAAKYAVTPAACYETVALALKRARNAKAGRTPFEILEAAAGGDAHSRNLWRDYVAATKGRKQVSTSQGIKLKPEIEEEDLEEIMGGQPIAEIGQMAMGELDRRRLAAPLLDAVEMARPEDRYDVARAILKTLEYSDWGICGNPTSVVPDDPPKPTRPKWTTPDLRRGDPNAKEQEVIRSYEEWWTSKPETPVPCSASRSVAEI